MAAISPAAPAPAVPFRLSWEVRRPNSRPVIGDALLLRYPEVAKALAASTSDKTAGEVVAAAGGGA
jgi:hypothetical protein